MRVRRVLLPVAAIAALILALIGSAEVFRGRDFTGTFAARKGDLLYVDERAVAGGPPGRVFDVRLRDDRDIVLDCRIQVPTQRVRPRAALVLLGGLRTGRRTIEYLSDVDDLVLLAIDYPYDGKKSGLSTSEFVRALPDIRRALMDTVPAVMLAVDYLLSRPDVDPERIVVVGGSLGALFSPALVATDARVSALALLFGAGDLRTLLRANLGREVPGWLVPAAAWAASIVTAPFEPLKYIGQVSPRPVFMLNGLNDPRMPQECSRQLHEAAREPKAVRIIDAGHVDVRSEEFRELVRTALEAWLIEEGIIANRPVPELQ